MAPLFARWGPAYHGRFSQVTIRITSSSSGTGIAVSALMVVYHVPGIGRATHLRLDGKLLARIYAGQIKADT